MVSETWVGDSEGPPRDIYVAGQQHELINKVSTRLEFDKRFRGGREGRRQVPTVIYVPMVCTNRIRTTGECLNVFLSNV